MNDQREGVDTGNNDVHVDVDTDTNDECEDVDTGTNDECEDVDTDTNDECEDVDTGTNEICEDVDTGTNDVYVPADTDLRIWRAAFDNKWDDVRKLFEERPELMIKPVNEYLETPLMLAVGINSHEFVKQMLKNVETHDRDKWCGVNIIWNNALHYAAKAGNIEDAKLMLQCLPETMTTIKNIHGDTPATLAAKQGRKDMIDEVFKEYADTIKMTHEYEENDVKIYKAALRNKWDDVRELFEGRPALKYKAVNERLETPLMIAVGTNSSHEFVKQLLNNVEHRNLYDDEWCGMNMHGNNALHYAAKVGNIIDAKLMLQCLPLTMRWNKNIDGDTPLLLATKLGRKDMIDEVFSKYNMLSLVSEDYNVIASTIQAGLPDLALRILGYSKSDEMKLNGLEALATKPESFRSGNRLGFWCGLICPWMPTIKSKIPTSLRRICRLIHIIRSFNNVLLLPFAYVKTWLQQIQEIKRKDLPSQKIVLEICDLIEMNPKDAKKYLEPAIATAVKYGTVELIEECILAYPGLIWYEFDGYNLFHLAIKERQVQVYNLLYQMSGHKAFVASELHGEENALHIAAKLAPSYQLSTITGAALQLQRQLQWYQEVEAFVEPEHVKALNEAGKTPWMVFVDAHKDLLKEGQEWMKDTATSCTIVAALIVTITFAAAITVPGGNKDDGKPVFINKSAFLLFMISDALALFSSSTSLLMFLGILTSRYAEMDFLHALPKRLAIGLASLFLSIAATMIAFGATLVLLLHDDVTWISAPVVMMTSIPVVLYALLQFPLLVEIVWSTYGPSIFRKQGSRMIY